MKYKMNQIKSMNAHGVERDDEYRKTEQGKTSVGLLIESRGKMWNIRENGTGRNRSCLYSNAERYGIQKNKGEGK
jgi:hypothetical protein